MAKEIRQAKVSLQDPSSEANIGGRIYKGGGIMTVDWTEEVKDAVNKGILKFRKLLPKPPVGEHTQKVTRKPKTKAKQTETEE